MSLTVQRKLSRMSTLDEGELLSLAMEQISLLQHRVGGVTRNAKATDKTLLQLLKTI